MSVAFSWVLLLIQILIFIPAVALIILVFYALILAIRALRIYIRKNS